MESLHAVTQASVAEIPLKRFGKLLEEHPRIGARFLLSVQRERGSLMSQLVSMGRTSAASRLAAFLLDLMDRLQPLGEVQNETFHLALTQEHIADALGLTNVHVNRVFRTLTEQGLIAREYRTIAVLDWQALVRLASRRKQPLLSNLDWLPAGR